MKENSLVILIDIDGTAVLHQYPYMGENAPDAVRVLKALVAKGHKLVINTMRDKRFLRDAEDWFKLHQLPLYGVNRNPTQYWTTSPKVHGDISIDDIGLGTPLANYGCILTDVADLLEKTLVIVQDPENFDTLKDNDIMFFYHNNQIYSTEKKYIKIYKDSSRNFVDWKRVEILLKKRKIL